MTTYSLWHPLLSGRDQTLRHKRIRPLESSWVIALSDCSQDVLRAALSDCSQDVGVTLISAQNMLSPSWHQVADVTPGLVKTLADNELSLSHSGAWRSQGVVYNLFNSALLHDHGDIISLFLLQRYHLLRIWKFCKLNEIIPFHWKNKKRLRTAEHDLINLQHFFHTSR